jgi:2-polyprenyl-6-methoxyphenol hydroxylase-like FAD-dependent oxidoreductase
MRILFIGGGITGLGGAMVLARDGHTVTVLERDPAPPGPPLEAWDRWSRRGVGQFRLPHGFLPRFRAVLEQELPDALAACEAAGALRYNRVTSLPEAVSGGHWPGDERFDIVTGRRPMIEATLAGLAARQPGVEIRRGVAVRGLLTDGHDDIPHVAGVVTDRGERLLADLVVDAGGRRSALPDMLVEVGATRPTEERADSGFMYFARHFRSADGHLPPMLGPPLQHYATVSLATLPADNGHWSVVLFAATTDRVLRRARDVGTWTRIVSAYPLVADWLDAEPTTGVDVMASVEDRVRRFVVGGRPVATGVVAVGDAAACTSPSIGRGASIALLHVVTLRDVLRAVDRRDHGLLVEAFELATAGRVTPYVDDTLAADRHRRAQIAAERGGDVYAPDDPAFRGMQALVAGAGRDPVLLRALSEVTGMLARGADVVRRPEIAARLAGAGTPAPLPGPDRGGLLDLVAGAAA